MHFIISAVIALLVGPPLVREVWVRFLLKACSNDFFKYFFVCTKLWKKTSSGNQEAKIFFWIMCNSTRFHQLLYLVFTLTVRKSGRISKKLFQPTPSGPDKTPKIFLKRWTNHALTAGSYSWKAWSACIEAWMAHNIITASLGLRRRKI